MGRFRWGIAIAVLVAAIGAITGCAASISEERLNDAVTTGAAPELEVALVPVDTSTIADMFRAKVTWDAVDGAIGYQLQSRPFGDGDAWSTVKNDGDLLLAASSHSASIFGYERTVAYQVRAVFDDGTHVSPWSAVRSIKTDPGNALYEVEGTARTASITMRTNTGTEQQSITVPLTSVKTGKAGIWLQGTNMTPYISAQARDYGTITCRITIMGVVVSENTSSGYGSIATCSP